MLMINHTTTVRGRLSQAARFWTIVVFPVPVSPTRRTGSLNFTEHATLSRTSNARRISAKGPFWINAYTFETKSYQTNESLRKMYVLSKSWLFTGLSLHCNVTLPTCNSVCRACKLEVIDHMNWIRHLLKNKCLKTCLDNGLVNALHSFSLVRNT